MQLKELYSLGKNNLSQKAIETPGLEAYILLCESEIIHDMSELYSHPEMEVDNTSYKKFLKLLNQRIEKEPIAYILGKKEFYSRTFKVDSNVLIPRPETELLVEETLRLAEQLINPKILDLGTGSGCIAVTLAELCENARIVASDISEKALNIARENTANYNLCDMITFASGDLLGIFKNQSFDIIASNPPYISEPEMSELDSDVRDYEPNLALTAGEDGLKYIKKIILESKRVLKNGGWCVLEIGHNQAVKVMDLMKKSGYCEISAVKDLNGIDRVIKARWKK